MHGAEGERQHRRLKALSDAIVMSRVTLVARSPGRMGFSRTVAGIHRDFAKGSVMNAPVANPAAAPSSSTSLDQLIYIELLGRAFLRVENNAVIKPDPAALAKLSMELAEVFRKAEVARLADLGPKNVGYEVKLDDITNWERK